jgi:hypothetical protein
MTLSARTSCRVHAPLYALLFALIRNVIAVRYGVIIAPVKSDNDLECLGLARMCRFTTSHCQCVLHGTQWANFARRKNFDCVTNCMDVSYSIKTSMETCVLKVLTLA